MGAMTGTDWLATLFSGLIGSVIAVVGTFAVAVSVLNRQIEKQSKKDRELARDERRIVALITAIGDLQDLMDMALQGRFESDDSTARAVFVGVINKTRRVITSITVASPPIANDLSQSWANVVKVTSKSADESRQKMADLFDLLTGALNRLVTMYVENWYAENT